MKVGETLGSPSNLTGTSGREDKKVTDSKETTFQGQLRLVETRSSEERLKALAEKIEEQGRKLSSRTDIRELKKYKNLISDFMEEAVGNSHKFSKQSFLDKRGRHRMYAVVKKVDEQLELLTHDVLSHEKDNIKILQRLDDIRGLILDIIL